MNSILPATGIKPGDRERAGSFAQLPVHNASNIGPAAVRYDDQAVKTRISASLTFTLRYSTNRGPVHMMRKLPNWEVAAAILRSPELVGIVERTTPITR
jgi:hypothetical protein